jgi:hypothetical protein
MKEVIAISERSWLVRQTSYGPVLYRPEEEPSVTLEREETSDASSSRRSVNYLHASQEISIDDIDTTVVHLCSKYIEKLTPVICRLSSCETERMYLCCNLLTQIPKEIGCLRKLTVLSLERNNITELPETIGMLSNLRELRVNYNRLYDLPDSMILLQKLEVLDLSHNAFHSLPSFIGRLKSLRTLDIASNKITVLPAELMKLQRLTGLYTRDCPFITELPLAEDLDDMRGTKFPRLLELSARVIDDFNLSKEFLDRKDVPDQLKRYFRASCLCSSCNRSYWSYSFTRFSWWQRIETAGYSRSLPVVHRMCDLHFTSEEERIKALFATTQPKHVDISTHRSGKHLNTLVNDEEGRKTTRQKFRQVYESLTSKLSMFMPNRFKFNTS